MKKKIITCLAVALPVAGLVAGAFSLGMNVGVRRGALKRAVDGCAVAMQAGEALAAADYDRTSKCISLMLGDAEVEMLRFDNRDLSRADFVSAAHARFELSQTFLALHAYWQNHPRLAPLGQRVDASNVQKYGLAGGATINAGLAGYERAYSNSLGLARAYLKR